MKNKLTALVLMLMLGLSVHSASAMTFSSEDPEAQTIWEFFLPFLNAQSAEERAAIEAQFNAEFVSEVDHDEDHLQEDDADESYDYSAEKEEILADLDEEIIEVEDATLRAQLKLDYAALVTLEGEAFNEALETLWEQLDNYWDEMDGNFEEDENFDFAAEREEIMAELTEEVAEIEEATLRAELEADLETLRATEDEDTFWDMVDAGYDKVDQFYGYGEDDHDCDDHDDEDEDEDDDDWFNFDFDEDEEEDDQEDRD